MRLARFALAAIAPFTLAGLAGCSDSAPPAPQGALALNFGAQSTNPSACKAGADAPKVGEINATEKKTELVSGGPEGAKVSCTVAGSGTFEVEGTIVANGTTLTVDIPKIEATATEAAPATGSATFTSLKTFTTYTATGCQFYFEGNARLAAGNIWVTFKCPDISDRSTTPASICQISKGYLALENCSVEVAGQ